jgi:integrase
MPRTTPRIPSYRRHRASGQAIVTLNDRDFYLGPWNSPASKAEYDRITSEWLVRGRRLDEPGADRGEILVKQLLDGYWTHVVATMPDLEAKKVKLALKPVRKLYGEAKAAEFGPVAFKAVRATLIEAGLSITTVRDRLGTIKRMIAWGVENELLPGDALHRLQAVSGLRAGRDKVKPARKVAPAREEHITAILDNVSPTIRAMVELQAVSGMRPGELWVMTTGQIDRTVNPWMYSPVRHKTASRGKFREVPLGPKAQAILLPWLKADPDAILFSPIEAAAQHYEAQRQARRTPLYPSSRKRRGKRKAKKQTRHVMYNKNSYAQAIERGCIRAKVPVFTPNQIRHTFATKVRRDHGLEAAQVLLGHSKADVTQIYAERNRALATEVARQIG